MCLSDRLLLYLQVFTRVLKNFHLPVGDNPPACVPKDYLSIISSFVVWIICSMVSCEVTA